MKINIHFYFYIQKQCCLPRSTANYNSIRKTALNVSQRQPLSSLVSICNDNTKIENLVKIQCNYVIMLCILAPFADSFCCTDQLPVISVALQQLGVYTCIQMHAVHVQTVSQLYHGSDSIYVPLSHFTCTPTFATEEGSRK